MKAIAKSALRRFRGMGYSVLGLFGLVVGLAAISHAQALYSITDLGTLPGHNLSQAYALNNNGQVVGLSGGGGTGDHAFLWQNGTMIDLGRFSGDTSAYASDINDLGVIVGQSRGDHAQVFRWTEQNGLESLGDFDGRDTGAPAYINDSGEIAATADPLTIPYAALYSGGQWTLIGGTRSSPAGINNVGQIVMNEPGSGSGTVVLREADGTNNIAIDSHAVAIALNDAGMITANQNLGLGTHAVTWSTGFGLTDLGTLGGTDSFAADINNAGIVVGNSELSNHVVHPFLFANGEMNDLYDMFAPGVTDGWDLGTVTGINDHSQIIGYGTHNGQAHAYLLSVVVPESGSAVLLAIGLGTGVALLAERRRFVLIRRDSSRGNP